MHINIIYGYNNYNIIVQACNAVYVLLAMVTRCQYIAQCVCRYIPMTLLHPSSRT